MNCSLSGPWASLSMVASVRVERNRTFRMPRASEFQKKIEFAKIVENPMILRTPLRCSATASSFGPKCTLGRSPNVHFGSELSTLLRAAQGCAQNLGIFENVREFNFF